MDALVGALERRPVPEFEGDCSLHVTLMPMSELDRA